MRPTPPIGIGFSNAADSYNIKIVQHRLSAIISSAMDGVITVDEHQRITVLNNAAETIFRCSAEDALGQSLDKFTQFAEFR